MGALTSEVGYTIATTMKFTRTGGGTGGGGEHSKQLEGSFLFEAPRYPKASTNRPSDKENSNKHVEMEWWNDNERGKSKHFRKACLTTT